MRVVKHGLSSLGSLVQKIRKLSPIVILPLIGVGLLVSLLPVYGNQPLSTRTLSLSGVTPSQVVSYQVSFSIDEPDDVGSVKLTFCSDSPLEGQPCTAPNGFDLSAATLTLQNGLIDMSIASATANEMILSRTATPIAAPLAVIFTLNNVTNPSGQGSYYLRVSTHGSSDGSGPRISYGGLAYSIAEPISISAEVPPYLLFCSAVTVNGLDCDNTVGNYINFGNLSSAHSSSAQSQFLAATNAANGYGVTVSGTTLVSGNNIIGALASPDISRPQTSQFGINLRANSDPAVGANVTGPGTGNPLAPYNTANYFTYHSGDQVALSSGVEDFRKYTVSYLINISTDQPSGVYASTLNYTATANF